MVNRKSKSANFLQHGSPRKQLLENLNSNKKKNTKNKKRKGAAVTWDTAKTFFEEREKKKIEKESNKKIVSKYPIVQLSCIFRNLNKKDKIIIRKSIWLKIQEGEYYQKVSWHYNNEEKYLAKWVFEEGNLKILKAGKKIEYLYNDSVKSLIVEFVSTKK